MEDTNKISVSSLSNVPETMLIPLYLKAKETKENGVILDKKAVEIVNKLDYDFSGIDKDWKTQIGVVVRTVLFDGILRNLAAEFPKLVIVNLGAGLDTRQERFPDIKWYQLDLPQSIEIRKQFFNTDKAIMISKSILDFSWLKDIEEKDNILFIAEGIFMYFSEMEVKSVLEQISLHFTHSFIAFNTIHHFMAGKKHSSIKTEEAPLKWGIRSLKEVLEWNLGWKKYQLFYPLDYYKARWRWMRLLNLINSMRKGYIVAVLRTEK